MAQELEILKILADIAVIFISITVPTYAIAVSFLGKEHSRVLNKIKNERERLEQQLKTGGEGLRYEEVEKKVDEIRVKEKKLKQELRPLSVFYVVVLPSIFFALALLGIIVGISNHPQSFLIGVQIGYDFFGVVWGTLFVVVGVIVLILVLLKIEAIAKRMEEVT